MTVSWRFHHGIKLDTECFYLGYSGVWTVYEDKFTGNAGKNGKVTVKNFGKLKFRGASSSNSIASGFCEPNSSLFGGSLEKNRLHEWRIKVVTTSEGSVFRQL